ncbi:MAG: beta-L-arabinofuranosidase domain-containing protein [Verrucomicrobiia bacterium]
MKAYDQNKAVARQTVLIILSAIVTVCFFCINSLKADVTRRDDLELKVNPVVSPKAVPFSLKEVRLLDGSPFKTNQDRAVKYLLSLEPDRFLANFRKEAGLKPKAEHYGGWERMGVSGHSCGHYLSACSIAYASTGDQRFKERVNYIVDELAECQKANGDGYVAAIPNGRKVFADVEAGNIRSAGFDLNGCWVPIYTLHKLMAGLRDAYRLCDNSKALEVECKLADWMIKVFSKLNDDQMQKVMACEHGGINEVLADLYADTGETKYLDLSKRFHHKAILEPLAKGIDILPGKHANTQIPKLIGLATRYELTGSETDRAAAEFFWNRVVYHHSYVTGGHSDREYFGEPDKLNNRLSTDTTETCNVYNMLKLTRHIFGWDADARVADFYERALFNHILSTQHPDGRVIYNLTLKPGHFKVYQPLYDGFTCCMGTGMENHIKYGEAIYFHDNDSIYVNLFIPSVVKWSKRGVVLKQESAFPYSDQIKFTVECSQPQDLTLKIRHPHWAKGELKVKVNGKDFAVNSKPSTYAEIKREFRNGDVVEVSLPMSLRTESMPDNPNRIAVFYGPVLLAANLGPVNDPEALKPFYVPVILAEGRAVNEWVKPVSLNSLLFRTDGVGKPRDVELTPFFSLHDRRYTVFLDLYTQADWAKREEMIKAEIERQKRLEARTVDVLHIGEMQPERDHNLTGERTTAGEAHGRKWRHATDGGWFAFDMKAPKEGQAELVCTYWGSDAGNRIFDILIDGEKIASQKLENNKPNEFFDVTYPIPERLLKNKEKINVRFQARPGATAGGVFGVRLLIPEQKDTSTKTTSGTATGGSTPKNLIPNSSFEDIDNNNRPRGWRTDKWGGEANYSVADIGRTGKRSVIVSSEKGADAAWGVTVPVEPFSRYRLSGWIKTENVKPTTGRGALLDIHNIQITATEAVTGTKDWTPVSVEFDVDEQDFVQVHCLLGGWGLATGKAYYDDIELVQLSKRDVGQFKITVDAAKKGAPVSKYIYGQFIEHLGRCIYGGIWAEMLEDRKFYYPITANYNPYRGLKDTAFPVIGASPWQIIGAAENVSMSTNKPFVGRHTPLIKSAGIRQLDLGITKGKSYTGYIWAKSDDKAVIEVTLGWGKSPSERQTVSLGKVPASYKKIPFKFTAGGTTDRGFFEINVKNGSAYIGTVSLMPADNIEGMRADTLALLKELNSPIYRWPGGNFVSGYDWRDGIGDRDRRPPRTNPAWTGLEHNDFGLHEFIRFCRILNAEPVITVNTGFGDAYSAAAELEYCNGSTKTYWGKKRAENGSPEPFNVKYWGIGNEMFGRWQLGYMQLEHYVIKHNWVVDKMREVDPTIICIGSGDAGPWSEGMLRRCYDHMELIDEHFYCGEKEGLYSHMRQVPNSIRSKAEFHRNMRAKLPVLKDKDIRIAMMEWNYWYGPQVFGEIGTRYFLKDALGIAAGLHEYARQSDIIHSAFYAQTVNVIGCIKTSKRNAAFETTGLVLKLYRQHFGDIPLNTQTSGLIDAQATLSKDGKRFIIGVVNPSLSPQQIQLSINGCKIKPDGVKWQIAGNDPKAFNDPDIPPRIIIEEQKYSLSGNVLSVSPCSVTLFSFPTE